MPADAASFPIPGWSVGHVQGFGERLAKLRPTLNESPGAARSLYFRGRMPKMKSHSGAKKRFKKTGSGKLKHRQSFSSHQLEHKSPKRKRRLGRPFLLQPDDTKRVKKLLGAGSK
jgi:large subunit ribosomal protein L35